MAERKRSGAKDASASRKRTPRASTKDQTPEAANARLRTEVKDRRYAPDPNRATDLEKIRERALLKDFETYGHAPQKNSGRSASKRCAQASGLPGRPVTMP
jgi:hypothetical protein